MRSSLRSPRPALPVLIGIVLLVAAALASAGAIRERASAGLGRGMPTREAELARGFVLGEDENIDEKTKEEFRRSGLSHLLAVSGENVTLLALLAMPVLALFGIPLRERLLWALALIAVYVPVAGAGPSIQRAGVMGAVSLLALMGGRRSSRFYGLTLAAIVTLAVDPGVAADIGWQLSFAAVLGILLVARPISRALLARLGEGPWSRALADGIAVTIAATLATAPLIAYHFETLSTTTLVANILALPAVAPAMWLGMCSAALAQVPGLPLEPLNELDAVLLAYVAQVASWCARPEWAELRVHLDLAGLLGAYVLLIGLVVLWLFLDRFQLVGSALKGLAAVAVGALLFAGFTPDGGGGEPPARGLRISVLDVGQGDAILLQPAEAEAVLVDGGPPGDELARKLEGLGVDELGAAMITHDQSDHAAGVEELFGRLPIGQLLFGRLGRQPLLAARAAGIDPQRVAAGQELRSGNLHLRVLWPPAPLLEAHVPGQDENQTALVVEACWRDFRMLLTADAEAEAVPLDPGPVDVLKVAHHGSDDAGLGPLLDRIRPQLAVISVGADNPYRHPTTGTLATLSAHQIPTLRTDLDGDVTIEVSAGSFRVDG